MGKGPKGKFDSENECCLVYNDYITFNGRQADLGAGKNLQKMFFFLTRSKIIRPLNEVSGEGNCTRGTSDTFPI